MAEDRKDDEIGALWTRCSAKGEYMSGKVNGVDVVCFRNTKGGDKAPQWRVLRSRPRDAARPPASADVGEIPW